MEYQENTKLQMSKYEVVLEGVVSIVDKMRGKKLKRLRYFFEEEETDRYNKIIKRIVCWRK